MDLPHNWRGLEEGAKQGSVHVPSMQPFRSVPDPAGEGQQRGCLVKENAEPRKLMWCCFHHHFVLLERHLKDLYSSELGVQPGLAIGCEEW